MGVHKRNTKSTLQRAIVVQIKIVSIALTGLLIKLDNIKINRFHLNTVGGKGRGGLIIRCSSFFFVFRYNMGL